MSRAAAAMAVVFAHVSQQNGAASLARLAMWGVPFFFVISGFCIHLPHARATSLDASYRVDWRQFYRARARRILPPHYAALAMSVVAGTLMPSPILSRPTAIGLVAHLLMIHAFFGAAIYSSINAAFWSIGIETTFYALYPMFLAGRRCLGGARLTGALLFFGLTIYGLGSRYLTGDARFIAQHIFMTNWWQWALGAWLADLYVARALAGRIWTHRRAAYLWAALIVSLGLVDPTPLGLHVRDWLIPIACGLLLATLVTDHHEPRVQWLERVGTASYSLYLTHPIAIVAMALFCSESEWPTWIAAPMEGAASIGFAFLFFRFVESRFLSKHGRHLSGASSYRRSSPFVVPRTR